RRPHPPGGDIAPAPGTVRPATRLSGPPARSPRRALALGSVGDYPAPSSPGRPANMRAIRRTNTKPEIALRSALHRQGYRFRKDLRLVLNEGAKPRPDIALTARRAAVFVERCFCRGGREHGRDRTVNQWYWAAKLRRNVERDRAADAALAAAGWRVVRIWEHVAITDAVAAVVAELAQGDDRPPSS